MLKSSPSTEPWKCYLSDRLAFLFSASAAPLGIYHSECAKVPHNTGNRFTFFFSSLQTPPENNNQLTAIGEGMKTAIKAGESIPGQSTQTINHWPSCCNIQYITRITPTRLPGNCTTQAALPEIGSLSVTSPYPTPLNLETLAGTRVLVDFGFFFLELIIFPACFTDMVSCCLLRKSFPPARKHGQQQRCLSKTPLIASCKTQIFYNCIGEERERNYHL